MSETDEWNGEKTGFSVLDINLIRRRRKEPYHRDLTKGGRTLDRHVELLVSGRLRGSVVRAVNIDAFVVGVGTHLVDGL